MIIKPKVKNEWKIYSAEQFKKDFNRAEEIPPNSCDEDYIIGILEKENREFMVTFRENPRDNSYEEYWIIQEIVK